MAMTDRRRPLVAARSGSGPAAAAPLLEVRDLDYSYGPVQVLFGVSLGVAEGEVLALLGTNGAGKSTVLRAVTGLGRFDGGEILFDGAPLESGRPSTRVEKGIVLLPGGRSVFPALTVEENLRARGYRFRNGDIADRVERALDRFPVLRSRRAQPAGTLSGGEQQMLALSGALLHDPRVLLVDELSLGLAPVVVQELLEVVAGLRDDGVTMVIVEQSVNVALSVADRAVFMEKGEVRFSGEAEELLERDDLVRAVFLGDAGG
jgi:ABC-type branched-subunit amino acid transport system ATPase component